MDRKIPAAVIAVVSDALALRYTHAQIDQFMGSAGIELSQSPPGNWQVKTRGWLRRANGRRILPTISPLPFLIVMLAGGNPGAAHGGIRPDSL